MGSTIACKVGCAQQKARAGETARAMQHGLNFFAEARAKEVFL